MKKKEQFMNVAACHCDHVLQILEREKMKTRNKIILVSGIFFLSPLVMISYLVLAPLPSLPEPLYTGNPDECWYEDGDGVMQPCQIETGKFAFFVIFLVIASPFFIIGAILLAIICHLAKQKASGRNEN